jgi:hypothetical protein
MSSISSGFLRKVQAAKPRKRGWFEQKPKVAAQVIWICTGGKVPVIDGVMFDPTVVMGPKKSTTAFTGRPAAALRARRERSAPDLMPVAA